MFCDLGQMKEKCKLLPDEFAPRAGPGAQKRTNSPSPRRLKKLSSPSSTSPKKKNKGGKAKKKNKSTSGQISVDDEVVEIFRFAALTLKAANRGQPDSTWDLSLFDSRASAGTSLPSMCAAVASVT